MQIPSDLVFGVRVAAPQPRVFSSKDPQVAAAPYAAAGDIGETIKNIGIQFEERAADLENVRKFTELSTELTKGRTDLDARMAEHRDHETYMPKWESEWKKLADPILKASRVNPDVYKVMNAEVSKSYSHEYSSQVTRQRQYQVDNTNAAWIRHVETQKASIKDEYDLQRTVLESQNLNTANTDLFGAQVVEKNRQAIPKEYATTLVNNTMAAGDFEKAIAWLENDDSAVSKSFLVPGERMELLDKVKGLQLQKMSRHYQALDMVDSHEKKWQAENYKKVMFDYQSANLSPDLVEQVLNGGELDDRIGQHNKADFMKEFRAWSKSKEGTVGDNPLYHQLVAQFWQKDGQFDIKTAANNAHDLGQINGAEWAELLKHGAMDTQFKQSVEWDAAKQYVLHQLDPKYSSLLGSSLTTADDQKAISNAVTELYSDWKAGLTANESKLRITDKYRGMIKSYSPAPKTATLNGKVYDLSKVKDAAALFAATNGKGLEADQWKAVWRGLGVEIDNTGKPVTGSKQ